VSPWAVRRADYVTADSRDQIEVLRRMGAAPHTTGVIGWGVDFREFSGRNGRAWREAHGIRDDRVVILSPRRWVENSNIPIILDAFAFVRRRHKEAVLILKNQPGSPVDLSRRILSKVQELGITDATVMVDEISEAERPEMYAASDIAVSACSSDGTPVSVLEAMAARSVVVAGDLPSLREWVRDGETGVLVPVGDPEALGGLADAAYEMVRRRADRERTLGEMERIYQRLAAR
jgi:glycosyltransferase involved in cell wall biosynthesis